MAPFGSKNKSKRPKFLFNLQINELVNVPQSSGFCFVKWNFKEGTGTSGGNLPPDTNIQSSIQSKGATPHVPVKHHRVQWNYTLGRPVQIKLQVDKNKNITPKIIVFEVYFESTSPLNHSSSFASKNSNGSEMNGSGSPISPVLSHRSSILRSPSLRSSGSFDISRKEFNNSMNATMKSSGSNTYAQKVTGKIFLGKIEINVAEYIRDNEEPISNRFLLKDSKINSILNITFQLKLIRGSYDDFNIPKQFSTGQLSSHFQNGLSNLFDSSISDIASTPTSSSFPNHSSSGNGKSRPLLSHSTQPSMNSNSYSLGSNGLSTISSSLNPLIDSLYEKTFQLSWDERPNEYSPRECIEDILRGGNGWAKNENGISLIDLQALRLKNIEAEYYSNDNSKDANRKMSIVSNEDEKYWNNMDNREFLERKHQQILGQNKPKLNIQTDLSKNNLNDYSINLSGSNAPFDAIIRDAKSWSVKQANM
ncbi:hypothetical protein MOUN0_N07206 [Monosporozyma unispora]|nr:hypothetical protein C6P44_003622 [Kazachstania unispora]